jgi:hypothetical protein
LGKGGKNDLYQRLNDEAKIVICEPSGIDLALGHKGRALLKVTSKGVSAHGSAA